jgi:hypothetical protein
MIVRTTTVCVFIVLICHSILETTNATGNASKFTIALQGILGLLSIFRTRNPNVPPPLDNKNVSMGNWKPCDTEEDLDFEQCFLDDLDVTVLQSICTRMGIDPTKHIFPFALPKGQAVAYGDYVLAANECLKTEQDVGAKLRSNEIDLHDYIELNREDIASLLVQLFHQQPFLLNQFEAKVKQENPNLWNNLSVMFGRGGEVNPLVLANALQVQVT